MQEASEIDSGPVFQAGGALSQTALYVKRGADEALFTTLSQRRFCYVLGPNQIGKTSLRHRTQVRLHAAGVRCASVDLSGIGTNISSIGTRQVRVDSWYDSVINIVAERLNLSGAEAFLSDHLDAPPPRRFVKFVVDLVLKSIDSQVVFFFDEIQSIKLANFPIGEFFAALRSLFNERPDNPELERFSCCFFGVLSPAELTNDPNHPPFNTASPIRLEDFAPEEMSGFAPVVEKALRRDARPWLDEVYVWTAGHPYMTQLVLRELCAEPPAATAQASAVVATLVQKCFLDKNPNPNEVFDYANKWFRGRSEEGTANAENKKEESKVVQLDLYRRLLKGEDIRADADDVNQVRLIITGMVAERRHGDERLLQVRNRVFAQVFDQKWVDRQQTDRQLELAVRHWITSGRLPQHLYRGSTLAVAKAWAQKRDDLASDESQFIIASMEMEAGHTHSQRARQFAIGATVFILAAIVGGAYGLFNRRQLERRQLDSQVTTCLYSNGHACQELAQHLEKRCRAKDSSDDCTRLAGMYRGGDGVPRDDLRAREFFTLGCEQKSGVSCHELGRFLELGGNYAGASEKYHESCKLGYGLGCGDEGYLLEKGLGGTPKDLEKAIRIYESSCSESFPEICNNLGWALMQPQRLDLERAERYLQAACAANYGLACLNLGFFYEKHKPASVREQSPAAYRKACDLNEARGCTSLGRLYSSVLQDKKEALRFYLEGCKGGDGRGCNNAGALMEDGKGTAKDPTKAALYYLRACEEIVPPYPLACRNLAELFDKGNGVPVNPSRAEYYRQKSP